MEFVIIYVRSADHIWMPETCTHTFTAANHSDAIVKARTFAEAEAESCDVTITALYPADMNIYGKPETFPQNWEED